MYLGRSSNMQKTPRSPAPQTATPRSFHPPAYYASAAAQSPVTRGDSNGNQINDREDTRRSRRVSRNHPAPLSSDSSASSVEQRPRLKSRTPRTGFPDMETQLLPSLRETVDRMTLTPARTSPYPQSAETDDRRKVFRTDAKYSHASPLNPPAVSSSYLQSTQKPALKSAMRSPVPTSTHTPKIQSPSVPPKSSLRSLLSRKCSGTLKSPFNHNKPSKEAREFVDNDFQSKTPTIQAHSRKNVDSNIPRPQGKAETIHLDDSDLERLYEANFRNRRKLTVANADVPPSSASSVSDAESKGSAAAANQSIPRRKWGKGHASIGLGLSLPSAIPIPVQRTAARKQDRCVSQEKTLRFSLPLSESVGSSYSDDINFPLPNRHYNTNPRADINERPSLNIHLSTKVRSPTLSISTKAESTDEETESEREGYSVRRARVGGDRRRSASCEARLSLAPSSSSEEGAVPIVTRSHSRQRSPKRPSPRTARIFPENLRDLIKSRNSLSNLAEVARTPTQSSTRRSSPEVRSSFKHDHLKSPNLIAELEGTPKAYSSKILQQERYRERQYEAIRLEHSEASAIAYDYRSAAARERSAFGLPPSLSDEMRASDEDEEQHLSQAESEISSLNQTRWQDGESDELSIDAESIFRSVKYKEKEKQKSDRDYRRSTPRLSVTSPTLSATSSFDARSEPQRQMVPQSRGQPLRDGSKTREGVIQEIFESEAELLRLFHICMRMFILPLRVQDSRTWIAGVPPNVAKLFDWFDDIVKLHELIYESLCSARDTMSPATDRVSEALRCFVLKVEVYQPYLVRLADVSTEITTLVDAHDTDFGEFVALQYCSKECKGWTLDRFLMLPVNRLAAYQDHFARMLDLTPKSHQDYLSTFSLSRSTDMVIRVMTEVKVREDEFNLLKAFSSRIQGLPMSSTLATRQRRLLHSGPLELVISGNSSSSVNSSPPTRTGVGSRSDRGSRLLGTMSTSSSKIFEQYHLEQSVSAGEVSCSNGGPDSSTPAKEASSWFSRLRRQSRVKSPHPPSNQSETTSASTRQSQVPPLARTPTISVHAFVFNDLVLLAQPLRSSRAEPQWNIYQDLGVFRPLSIARLEVQSSGDTLVSLETMVVDPEFEHLADRIDFGPSSFRTVDFMFAPACNKSFTVLGLDSEDAFFATWLDAFRQCSWTTLRKLTFPELTRIEGLSDHTIDTQLAISSLVGSGLPIPRSPSGTFPDMYGSGDSVFGGDEREERGWWSLRYQQIFRELRRQDSLLSEDEDAAGH